MRERGASLFRNLAFTSFSLKSPLCDFNKGASHSDPNQKCLLLPFRFQPWNLPFVSFVVWEMKFMCLCFSSYVHTKDPFAYFLSLLFFVSMSSPVSLTFSLSTVYICLFKAKKSTGIQTYIKYSNCIQIEGDFGSLSLLVASLFFRFAFYSVLFMLNSAWMCSCQCFYMRTGIYLTWCLLQIRLVLWKS